MLQVYRAQGALSSVASTSRACLHTSAVLHAESQRKRQARITRQANLAKRTEIQQHAAQNKPHVVLGTKPGDATKWTSSDLAKVLVQPSELTPPSSPETVHLPEGDVRLPTAFAYGIRQHEKELLFSHLPVRSADMATMEAFTTMPGAAGMDAKHTVEMRLAVNNANTLARIVDLRNANAKGIAFENRRRIVEAFSQPGKPNDTGRPEVQAALLTWQIRNLWDHLTKYKRDVANRRQLRALVHHRAKILKYLKRLDRDRYDAVLERLGLEPESIEGELVI
ncbi:hypothetical protein OF83DRAFT_1275621 [Amylostereum chailletii]|nr:hypothetical protein OF83DRAFT_1275621 [Amylostereum chailletii]